VFKGEGTVAAKIAKFVDVILPALAKTLEPLRVQDSDLFKENAVKTPFELQIGAGPDKVGPSIDILVFLIVNKTTQIRFWRRTGCLSCRFESRLGLVQLSGRRYC
jgi:hypothetical protein